MRTVLSSLAVVLCVVAGVNANAFHFSVTKSAPAKDEVFTAAPKRLQLWFSEAPAAVVSEIKLKKGAEEIALGKSTVVAAEKTLYAEPSKPLANGAYVMSWRAAGDDGHVLTGEVKFTVEIKKTH